jgi:hypothetical protein
MSGKLADSLFRVQRERGIGVFRCSAIIGRFRDRLSGSGNIQYGIIIYILVYATNYL